MFLGSEEFERISSAIYALLEPETAICPVSTTGYDPLADSLGPKKGKRS